MKNKLLILLLILINIYCNNNTEIKKTSIDQISDIYIFGRKNIYFTNEIIEIDLKIKYLSGKIESIDYEKTIILSSNESVIQIKDNNLISINKGVSEITVFYDEFSINKKFYIVNGEYSKNIFISEVFISDIYGNSFIEIYNPLNTDINLSAYSIRFSNEDNNFVFPENFYINKKSFIILMSSGETFFNKFGFSGDFNYMPELSNKNSLTIILSNFKGKNIDILYINGGDEYFKSDCLWGLDKHPNNKNNESIYRISDIDTDTAYDWNTGKPNPGKLIKY